MFQMFQMLSLDLSKMKLPVLEISFKFEKKLLTTL